MKNIIQKNKNQLFNYIVPIFKLGSYSEPKILGSAIFIQIEKYFFLISAAHVFEEFKEETYLYTSCNNDIYSMNGLLSLGNPKEIKDDIAIFNISDQFLDLLLATFKPLVVSSNYNKLNSNDFLLFMSGFPGNKSKTSVKDKNVRFLRFDVQTKLTNQNYKNTQNLGRIFEVQYPKKGDKNQKITHPKGMSGGGVFKIFNNESEEMEFFLIGINIFYSRKRDLEFNTMKILNAYVINTILLHEYPFLGEFINQYSIYSYKLNTLNN